MRLSAKRFEPTELGEIVNKLIVEFFPNIVNTEFTAEMEKDLDEVEEGKRQWIEVVDQFYKPFAKELENVEVKDMQIPVITNVTADYVSSKEDIKPLLIKQVSSSVKWEETIRRMIADGVDTFVEVGPGKALSGFIKKVSRDVKVFNVEDMASLEKTLEGLNA